MGKWARLGDDFDDLSPPPIKGQIHFALIKENINVNKLYVEYLHNK